MKSLYRGLLAVVGVIFGFLTLGFLSQTIRYLNLSVLGDQLSLGMFGFYVILTFLAGTATIVSFLPRLSTAKYLSGVGLGVGGLLLLSSLYLFTSDISSGLMLLIFAVVQIAIAGGVYGGGRILSSDEEEVMEDTQSEPGPKPTVESKAEQTVTDSSSTELGLGKIDWGLWFRGAQTLLGVSVLFAGIPITIDSPIGVPVLVIGFVLIPAVRCWGKNKLAR